MRSAGACASIKLTQSSTVIVRRNTMSSDEEGAATIPDDSVIEQSLRDVVKELSGDFTVNDVRTATEERLRLELGFLKDGRWKAKSKEIIHKAIVGHVCCGLLYTLSNDHARRRNHHHKSRRRRRNSQSRISRQPSQRPSLQ